MTTPQPARVLAALAASLYVCTFSALGRMTTIYCDGHEPELIIDQSLQRQPVLPPRFDGSVPQVQQPLQKRSLIVLPDDEEDEDQSSE